MEEDSSESENKKLESAIERGMEASNNTESFSRFFSRSGRFPLGDSPPPPPFLHLLYFRLFLLLSRIRLVTLFLVLLGRFTTLLVSVPRNGSLRPTRPSQRARL